MPLLHALPVWEGLHKRLSVDTAKLEAKLITEEPTLQENDPDFTILENNLKAVNVRDHCSEKFPANISVSVKKDLEVILSNTPGRMHFEVYHTIQDFCSLK